MSIEHDIETIQSSLKEVNTSLKAFYDQAQKDIKAHAQMSTETKASVDAMLIKQGELQANLHACEQVVAKLQTEGVAGAAREKSIGEVVASSEAIKGFNPSMQQQVVVKVGSIHRDRVNAATITSAGEGADLIVPQRVAGIIRIPDQRLFLRDLLNWGRTTSNSIEFVRETGFTNNANVVSENPSGLKPESGIGFELDSAPVATIAHWVRASKQVLADAGMLQGYIDGRLLYGLKVREEAQLLKGSGVGLNINGIYTQATAYSNPGVAVQAETAIDRLRIALLQVTLAEYEADGIVLSPIDWAEIELTKTTDNAYLFATPRGLATPGLWGRPVVATQAMDEDDFLVGAFKLGAQGWDREDANVAISNQDRDNFVKNLVTILAEERVALTVYRPEAFVKGDLADVEVS